MALFQLSICKPWLCFLAINICKGDTDKANGSQLDFICSHFPLVQQSYSVMKRSMVCIFSAHTRLSNSIGCYLAGSCLPVFESRSDDGFVELGDLPLQHGPQALSEAVVVLFQLLLVLFLVRSD